MKVLNLNVIIVCFLLVFSMAAQAQDDLQEDEFSAEDYIGIYMQVPEKVQKMIGLQVARVEHSKMKEKVLLNGRIPQDVEDITDVYASQTGIFIKYLASIGEQVSQGQVVCSITTETKEVIEIKAPQAGVVIAEFNKPGDRIDTISPLMTIADYSKIPINFDVYEKDVGKIQLNQKVLVYSSAYPDKVFEGKVIFISPRIDETSFTLKIRALIENPELLLKPGMFVRGEAVLATEKDHVAVPSFSVQNLDGIDVVFVQDEKESFIPTAVRVAYAEHHKTIIRGDVRQGDLVVVDGAYNLKSKILESEITGGCAHGH